MKGTLPEDHRLLTENDYSFYLSDIRVKDPPEFINRPLAKNLPQLDWCPDLSYELVFTTKAPVVDFWHLVSAYHDDGHWWLEVEDSSITAINTDIVEAAIDIVRKLNRTIADHIRKKEVEQWVENRKEIKKKRSALIPANQRLERAEKRREQCCAEQPLEFRGNEEMRERMEQLAITFCNESREDAEEGFVDEDTLASFVSWLFDRPDSNDALQDVEYLAETFRAALGKDEW